MQNGEVKAVQAPAADSIQIVNETKAAEQPAEEKAEQAASTTSDDHQGVAESTPLVPDTEKEDKKEDSEKDAPTEKTPLEDSSSGPTLTVEAWKRWQVHARLCILLLRISALIECFILIFLWMYKHFNVALSYVDTFNPMFSYSRKMYN